MVNEAFRGNGSSLDTALLYEQQLADAGFINVHVMQDKWPLNRWPKNQKYKQLGMKPLSIQLLIPHCIRNFKWQALNWGVDANADQGIWMLENASAGVASMSLAALTRPQEENGLGWSREEAEVLNAGVRRELKDTSIHAYCPV